MVRTGHFFGDSLSKEKATRGPCFSYRQVSMCHPLKASKGETAGFGNYAGATFHAVELPSQLAFEYALQICLGLEHCNLSCCLWILKRSVLHDQQKESSLCYAGSAFAMRITHQKALSRTVMLGDALQASWFMQNMHEKPSSLPDPDIFALDIEIHPTENDTWLPQANLPPKKTRKRVSRGKTSPPHSYHAILHAKKVSHAELYEKHFLFLFVFWNL